MNKMLTPLEIIDKSIAGIKAQGGLARNENGGCYYSLKTIDRGTNRCGVGVLLDPEDAQKWDERAAGEDSAIGKMVDYLSCCAELRRAGIDPEKDLELMEEIQEAHDASWVMTAEDFEREMQPIRKKYASRLNANNDCA